MDYAVLYESKTGNTQALAQAIYKALPAGHARLAEIVPDMAVPERTLFLGFWTDKGSCPEQTTRLLPALSGKRIALFGTAGFGGDKEYFSGILSRVRAGLPPDSEYLGGYMCQGHMPASVRTRYESMLEAMPGDARMQAMLDNFDRALSHPDTQDLLDAATFVEQTLSHIVGTGRIG